MNRIKFKRETSDDLIIVNALIENKFEFRLAVDTAATHTTLDSNMLYLAMVNLGMIETIGSGIKKMFSLQKEHFLPLPDYSLTENVELKIYGNIISQEYTQTLIEKPDLDLGTVFLLDKLQKGYPISDNDYLHIIIHFLKQQKRATRDNINQLLSDLLPTNLIEKQKTDKVKNLIYKLSKDGIIKNISTSRKNPIWTLAK